MLLGRCVLVCTYIVLEGEGGGAQNVVSSRCILCTSKKSAIQTKSCKAACASPKYSCKVY